MPLKFEQINDTSFQDTILSEKSEDVAGNDDCVQMNYYKYDDEMPVTTLNSGISTTTVDSSPDN